MKKYVNVIINKKQTDYGVITRCVLIEFTGMVVKVSSGIIDATETTFLGTRVVRADPYFTDPTPTQSLVYKIEDDGFTLLEDRTQTFDHSELFGVKRPYHSNFYTNIFIQHKPSETKYQPFEAVDDESAILYIDNLDN